MKKPKMTESERENMWFKLHRQKLNKPFVAQAKRSHKEYLLERVRISTWVRK